MQYLYVVIMLKRLYYRRWALIRIPFAVRYRCRLGKCLESKELG